MCHITDHSFPISPCLGPLNLVFVVAMWFLNSASSIVNSLILKLFYNGSKLSKWQYDEQYSRYSPEKRKIIR